MLLIGQFDSPFVRRVGIALRIYGMAFEHSPFSVMGDGDKFAHLNPLKRVPTLVLDDGEVLIESGAILDYLDEAYDRDKALIAASGPARRAALKRIATATSVADKAVAYFYTRRFGGEVDPFFTQRSEAQIRDGMAALNAECATRDDDWWHGDAPGHDDIAVAVVARFVSEAYGWLVSLADYPALAAHSARAEARAEFQAIQQEFIPPS
ncbi:glutathione S-transferase [Novosphingobium sp. SG751A]|uniref:glutathione S-transferase family protein n=1 Tax=Novosphingobium sp. SG751A TaxID=2587000 RepID=UPI001557B3D7|nr:glutathione S-transferase family protein [Novosphingobium sp. SG751A]NOW46529.1 glutathione S-transferase [Novosphingobium sp. SG751A]